MYALALSLEAKANPKVIPVEELYVLKANNDAISLSPKSRSDFDKGQEYGRFVVVDGHRKLVRYIIFRLDCEYDDIRVLSNVITSYWIAGLCRAHSMLLVMPLLWFILK